MNGPESPHPVPPATVEALLRLGGLAPPDPATIARIAVGAANALAAVGAAGPPGFDEAPDTFVAELARLASDGD